MKEGENKEIIVDNQVNDASIWCRGLVDSNTFNVATNSVEVIAATDTPCMAIDPSDGSLFVQMLSFDPSHVRMARIQTGGPVLDNHDSKGSVQNQLGVAENARLDGNKIVASLRYSKRAALVPFVNDVKDGIVRGISTRFRVYLYRDITQPTDQYRNLLAIDWEPIEISHTQIPEDFKSTIRLMGDVVIPALVEAEVEVVAEAAAEAAAEAVPMPGEETERSINKIETKIKMEETEAEKTTRLANEAAARTIVVNEERTRSMGIISAAKSVNVEPEFAEEHITAGTALDTFRSLLIDKIALAQTEQIRPVAGAGVKVGADKDAAARLLGFEEAITIRSFGIETLDGKAPKTEYGKKIANGGRRPTLADHGAMSLEANGVDTSSMNEGQIFSRAMATGDFPISLANVMNKNLRKRQEMAAPVWKKFAKKIGAKDFKAIFDVQLDGNTVPGPLTEKGEYPNVSFKEAGDSFKLGTDGLTFALTRQLFINDDLGAFEKFAPLVSDGFTVNQTNKVYGALFGTDGLGRVLGEDGIKVFDAAHKNLAASGSVMSLAAFTAAKTKMRRQTTLAGRIISGNIPKFLVIPPELEILAAQLINSTITPNTTAGANPFYGQFEILVEDFFTNTSRWLLVADPARMESVKYATLDGQEGIFTEQWWDHGKDCWKMKSRQDFAATVEEFRGLYQNPGA